MSFDIIISDVHLKASPKENSRRESFESFLRGFLENNPRRIICLGDIFEFWFEYKYVMFSPYFGVLSAFYELKKKNTELIFIGGNHDYWAGETLKEIGFKIMNSGDVLDFDHIKALLIHGDGLNKRDYGYRLFKRISRNRFLVRLFKMVHPDFAMSIASIMSRGSKGIQKSRRDGQLRDASAIRDFARKVFETGEIDAVIAGHCHIPECISFEIKGKRCWYVNSGDWVYNNTYVVWDGREFILKKITDA
ncbi:MAG: UDP-2,3-diacylglucosamine diphosphatase [Candidatus Hydrogenedentes bacterium]|nr:UDP-2,3-diacylglucosamine diphosphatase [Candidatus Hydrogenedentota bacterium]